MTIEVEGPGGVIVEFPDGTSPQTISAAMRTKFPPTGSLARSNNPAARLVGRSEDKRQAEYRAGQERGRQARANPARLGSRVGGDVIAPGQAAASQIGGAYRSESDMARTRAAEGRYIPTLAEVGQSFKNDLNTIGGAVGLAFSPLSGPVNALTGMAARGAERLGIGDEQTNKEIISTATMGARPAPGAAPYNALNAAPAVRASPAAKTIARRGRVDVPAARVKAAEMRASGVQPNLTAVAGDRGQRLVRAVGATNPVAGEALTARAQASAATAKPAVMDRTRHMVDDPRSADQLLEDIFTARDAAADANYAGPYATQVPIDDTIRAALADEPGRAALQRARAAAVANQRGERVAEIDALLSGEPVSVSAGTLDRIRIAMRERAQTAQQRGARDLGAGYQGRVAQIDQTLDAVPEMQGARATYRNQTQAIETLGRGRQDIFSTSPEDYQRWIQSLPPEALEANRVAIRQEILDTLGGQRSNTFGSIDELATSEYARDNLRAAFGQQEADSYIANLRARMAQTRADQVAAPGAGSRTAVLQGDMENLNNAERVVQGVGDGLTGRWGNVARNVADWYRSRGIPDDIAQEITRRASDPAELDGVLNEIERALGPGQAREFLSLISRPEVAVPALQSGAALQGQ